MKKKIDNLLKKFDDFSPEKKSKYFYPLLEDAFFKEDIYAGIEVLLSKKLTMGKITEKFEKKFATFIGSKYSVMVNSGSSANLLAMFASINPMRKNRAKVADEVLIPSLCWSTSLWPIVQAGLKPRFVDIDFKSLNVSADDFIKNINRKTKAIMGVHVLGNSGEIDKIRNICKKRKLILIEDTCESLGSKYKNKNLGTFGDFGTFSFYYSHQMTSGEGGMVVCKTKEDYDILRMLRSHGWSRGIDKKKKNNFNFINSGFNLRPTDIVASIGLSQLKKIKDLIRLRSDNRSKIISAIKKSKKWKNQFSFIVPAKNITPSWFGLPIILNQRYKNKKKNYLKLLNKNGIETRPIISGNFLNQPSIKLYGLNEGPKKFKSSQKVEELGFFIGLHIKPLKEENLRKLTKLLLKISDL
ncbi:DegT/DnrJ/EryC1/StrS family aminotransferase [Candidatus Pelagibacter sp. Uisw_092]|uniref:DegT/DnrJ/EryC1/StrS family aminotransferase n=1 Tax=Candidatus Pelagibacter sp. Uisw_092 TaxID=3230979 RepID=UPI0039EB042B